MDKINLRDSDREVMVDGVVRRLSDNILIAPPIPWQFNTKETGSFYPMFGYEIQDFKKKGDFVTNRDVLWRHWSYPFMIGPFAFGKGGFDAIIKSPGRGLYLGRTFNGLGSIDHFENREGMIGENRGFTIVMFEGDPWMSFCNVYESVISSIENRFDEFQPKKLRGNRHQEFKKALRWLHSAKPWIGNVHESPFKFSDDIYHVREGILKAHSDNMRR